MPLLATNALRYFAEVVRTGSIRAASETLFVAPSAIGRQLQLLEESLGAPLLERHQGRGQVKLTAAGELLMSYHRNISNESRRLQAEIEALQGLRRGHINFGMPESLVRDMMPRFIAGFAKRYPGFSYRVLSAGSPHLIDLLQKDEIDACFTFGKDVAPEVTVRYTRTLPLQVLVPKGHPLEGRESVRLSDCAEYGLAFPDGTMWARQHYDEMLGNAKIRPRVTLETNSYEFMRNSAIEGTALAFVTLPLDPQSALGRGVHVPLKDPRAKPQRFALCVRKGRNLPRSVETFLGELVQRLEALETPG